MPQGIYKRTGYNGTPEERFLRHVNKTTTCWLWTGTKRGNGYGSFRGNMGLVVATHRFSYEKYIGLIPNGCHVLHTCDNPSCVKPEHLFLGTHTDNMRDMWKKGRNTHVGEKNSRSILTEDKVIEMRKMYAMGGYSHAALGIIFGVARTTAAYALSGKSWGNIPILTP